MKFIRRWFKNFISFRVISLSFVISPVFTLKITSKLPIVKKEYHMTKHKNCGYRLSHFRWEFIQPFYQNACARNEINFRQVIFFFFYFETLMAHLVSHFYQSGVSMQCIKYIYIWTYKLVTFFYEFVWCVCFCIYETNTNKFSIWRNFDFSPNRIKNF